MCLIFIFTAREPEIKSKYFVMQGKSQNEASRSEEKTSNVFDGMWWGRRDYCDHLYTHEFLLMYNCRSS